MWREQGEDTAWEGRSPQETLQAFPDLSRQACSSHHIILIVFVKLDQNDNKYWDKYKYKYNKTNTNTNTNTLHDFPDLTQSRPHPPSFQALPSVENKSEYSMHHYKSYERILNASLQIIWKHIQFNHMNTTVSKEIYQKLDKTNRQVL